MTWDFDNRIPIYTQIALEVKKRILRQELKPGEKLSSVRDLAKEAGVNPNTMQKALADLEAQGLLQSERTSGRFVTEDQGIIDALRDAYLAEKIHHLIQELHELGLTEEDMVTTLKRHYKEATI